MSKKLRQRFNQNKVNSLHNVDAHSWFACMHRFFWATRFLILFFRFWAVRYIKLAIPSAFEHTLIYRIVSWMKIKQS